MSYFDEYSQRLSANGKNTGDSLTNNTINFINSYFDSSSTYREIKVYTYNSGYEQVLDMDCRAVKIERMGGLKELLLRPNDDIPIGAYVELDNEMWIVYDKYGGENSVSIKVILAKCNKILRWRDKNNELKEYQCYASASDIGSKSKQNKTLLEWNKYDVRLPVGQLYIFIESCPDTMEIDFNHRFILGKSVYEIVGIDDVTSVDQNHDGIIQFTIKITTKRSNDDFVNEIAENIYENEKKDIAEITEDGGRLW